MSSPVRPAPPTTTDRPVAVWLFVCCAMVFAMVVLGGVTRLTESGLSIVDWRPFTGILPPLNDADWQALFAQYKSSPEFARTNFWMTLADFKGIFWLEYLHRLWGRIIGAAFLLPFLYFLARGRLPRRLIPHLVVLFVLGGAQGGLGWYMVRSGLVDEPAVSQYRLAAHLGLAVAIYGYMLWLALGLTTRPAGTSGPARGLALVALIWASLTLLSGAFVAGLDAGLAYNTFPLMDGGLVPRGLFSLDPWIVNLFENTATVQFVHRWLAIGLVVYLCAAWFVVRRRGTEGPFAILAALGLAQAALGIATLLSGVVIALGALHQAGALIVFTATLWAVYTTGLENSTSPSGSPAG